MKKIVLCFAVAMMIFAMSVTSFAANTATFSTVTVDAGTTTASADYTLNFDASSTVGMIQINLILPEGITLTNVDQSEFAALADSTVLNDNAFGSGQFLVYEDDMMTAVSGSVKFTFTFALDAELEAGVYNIGIDTANTLVQNDGGDPMFDSYPGTTITVKAAGLEYENVDTKIADLVADTTPLVAEDGTEFTNVAKYTGSFNLGDIKAGITGEGEELLKVGFKKNDGVADTFSSIAISGTGTVEYSFLFYGIEDASVLDIDTYYTAKRIKATN